MIKNPFSRAPAYEHADPAQRLAGLAELPADAEPLARALSEDPDASVRAAAAARCTNLAALATALARETDATVLAALAPTLGSVLATSSETDAAATILHDEHCTDEIRADVARHTTDAERRRVAIDTIHDESTLIAIALEADRTETRKAAADRVHSPAGLRRLAESATERDRGVAREAKRRLEALESRADQELTADDILNRMAALETESGPILTPLVELERRWQALGLVYDAARQARYADIKRSLQDRFDREQEKQRDRARWVRRWRDWVSKLVHPESQEALAGQRVELEALVAEAAERNDVAAQGALTEASGRLEAWDAELARMIESAAQAEAAAKSAAEQAREAEQSGAVRAQIHALLHTAEQALAAGQLKAARVAVDELRPLRAGAGRLPPPTVKRIGQLMQSLGQLEKWETFGQQSARVQLCERAEALVGQKLDAPRIAQEVHTLREAWKALDKQYAGVPKALWTRFDNACTTAYGPAAQFFAQRAAQRKEARGQRETFIAMAAAHAPTLLAEPRDWRAIEKWLRETDQRWRGSELGGVAPSEWEKMDAELRTTLGPLREALAEHRKSAASSRQALIEEVTALAANPMARDVVNRVKAAQARWQTEARANPLPQRDDRALWEKFRAACDKVFEGRKNERQKEDDKKSEGRRGLEAVLARMTALATSSDDDAAVRREMRTIDGDWSAAKRQLPHGDPAGGALESKFRIARAAVDSALAARARSRQAASWQSVAQKELLCESLDRALADGAAESTATDDVATRWADLPAISGTWEQKLAARRDAALQALNGGDAASYRSRIERGRAARHDALLELELALGLAPPAELEAARRALQLQQLKARFGGAKAPPAPVLGSPTDRLIAWAAEPGVLAASDRARVERIFDAIAKRGG